MLRRYLRDDLTVLDFWRPYSAIMRCNSSTGTSVMRLRGFVIIDSYEALVVNANVD